MASGRPPFRAATTFAVLKRVVEEDPRSIQDVIPEVPLWLSDIVARLQAKNPADRFQTARAVADLLADCEAKLKAKQEVKRIAPVAVAQAAAPAAKSSSTSRGKWLAAMSVFIPVLALTLTELTGVTHLFPGRQPPPDPVNTAKVQAPIPVAQKDKLPSALEAEIERIAKLPAERQVEEVRKQLMSRNPGFDGNVNPKIDNGNVTELRFVTDGVTDISAVRLLTKLRLLECIGSDVFNGKLDANALNALKGLPLTELICRDSAALTDLSALQEMKLTHLDCRHTNVGNADLKNLTGITGLRLLVLWSTKVTDAGMKDLAGLKELRHLSLQNTKVTDEGLKELIGLHKLEYLDLYAMPMVTDAGLIAVARLKSLKHVDLRGTTTTDEGCDRLASILPALRIVTPSGRVIEPKIGFGK
jgi:hypothetical protein